MKIINQVFSIVTSVFCVYVLLSDSIFLLVLLFTLIGCCLSTLVRHIGLETRIPAFHCPVVISMVIGRKARGKETNGKTEI
jgi:hypothetical protein